MHEYSVARALIDRVEKEARARGAVGIARVTVRIGELAGIEVGLLQTAYLIVREQTACAKAPLDVVAVSALWECRDCRAAIAKGGPLRCARCGGAAALGQGDEIMLERIELEVP